MVKNNRKAWNNFFKNFKVEGNAFSKPIKNMHEVKTFLRKENAKKVLELGCGNGRNLLFLAKNGFNVYGIDISKYGVNIAKDWFKSKGFKAELKVGDVFKKLPYKDNFFDAVISVQVINHERIENIKRLIKEMERILKPEGLIYITFVKEPFKKEIVKSRNRVSFILPRTYIPLGGNEKGLFHYCFNKKIIKKEFENFKPLKIRVDNIAYPDSPNYHYYVLIGKLKKPSKI